jgi:nucleotide-binding universal stress UspA family protein
MKNILIAVDFEDNVKAFLNKATSLINAGEAKLWLVHIAAPDPDFVGYEAGPQYIRDARADDLRKEHKQLAGYIHDLTVKGFDAEGLLVQGPTIETILTESEKLAIELIVTGRHEHGFFYKLFNSPTSADIIDKAKMPVLIIPL